MPGAFARLNPARWLQPAIQPAPEARLSARAYSGAIVQLLGLGQTHFTTLQDKPFMRKAGSQQEGAEPAAGQHRTTAGLHTRGRPSCLLGSSSVMCPFLLPRRLLQCAVVTQQTCDSSSKQRVVNGARASAGSVSLRKPRRGPAGGRVTVTVA